LGDNQARHCLAVAVNRGRACRGSAWRLGSFGPVCEARTSTRYLRVAVGILAVHGREDVKGLWLGLLLLQVAMGLYAFHLYGERPTALWSLHCSSSSTASSCISQSSSRCGPRWLDHACGGNGWSATAACMHQTLRPPSRLSLRNPPARQGSWQIAHRHLCGVECREPQTCAER
jgi:hypothetical protein